ncbi:unnamed protein product [Brassica rapa]|uniref:Uncharacterized protein n=2 Tax=Brassica TaxID=3705 RepID=A0A8D9I6Z2_BRACM|nr:unnamed protein product [Brassica napus]CAG7911769.1 unnamed protein product [Brassica rapa]
MFKARRLRLSSPVSLARCSSPPSSTRSRGSSPPSSTRSCGSSPPSSRRSCGSSRPSSTRALSWLVLRIRNGLWFLITNIAQRVSLLCNSMVRPLTLVRLFGAGMILATFFLFNSSEYISSLDNSVAWIWRCGILVQVSLTLPLPRTLSPKEMLQLFQNRWCQSIPYDALKAAGSLLSYCAFEWLGSTVKIHSDRHLMYSSITFFLFLVIVDLLYDVEDAIAICDGYVFAGYGLMLNQEVIPKKFIHSTCFSFCLLKTYMRSNRDIILALIEKPGPVTEDIQNQSDAVAKKEEGESYHVLDMSGVVRRDQKVLYRLGSFTRVRSNTDEVGYN